MNRNYLTEFLYKGEERTPIAITDDLYISIQKSSNYIYRKACCYALRDNIG